MKTVDEWKKECKKPMFREPLENVQTVLEELNNLFELGKRIPPEL